MKVYIWGEGEEAKGLSTSVVSTLEELGLTDFVPLEQGSDEQLKTDLSITKDYALIIEEESIDFKDMIFEGLTPSSDELKSMFVSIIGGGSGGGCAPEGCGSGCSC